MLRCYVPLYCKSRVFRNVYTCFIPAPSPRGPKPSCTSDHALIYHHLVTPHNAKYLDIPHSLCIHRHLYVATHPAIYPSTYFTPSLLPTQLGAEVIYKHNYLHNALSASKHIVYSHLKMHHTILSSLTPLPSIHHIHRRSFYSHSHPRLLMGFYLPLFIFSLTPI